MTDKHLRAYNMLRQLLRDVFENIHGPGSWEQLKGNEIVSQIVRDLTETDPS